MRGAAWHWAYVVTPSRIGLDSASKFAILLGIFFTSSAVFALALVASIVASCADAVDRSAVDHVCAIAVMTLPAMAPMTFAYDRHRTYLLRSISLA